LPVAVLGHPLGALKVGVECPPGAIGFPARITMQDYAGDFTPIRSVRIRVQQTQVGDQVFVVVRGQDRIRRRDVSDIGIKAAVSALGGLATWC